MNKIFLKIFGLSSIVLVTILVSCSTEKDKFINRTYHGTTAKYNGYFNATELIRVAKDNFENSVKEDYYKTLPIYLLPNEEQVVDLYPAIDTAISKCTTVISKHSMPTASKPSKKNGEWNNWIDENWMLIGKSKFLKRKYDEAYTNFEYVAKFFANDESKYEALVWMAKVDIAKNDLTQAQLSLDKLEKLKTAQADYYEDNKRKKKRSRSQKKKLKANAPAKFPERLNFDVQQARAEIAIQRDNKPKAIGHLVSALEYAKERSDKARINFIIGQLMQEAGNPEARDYYTKSIRYDGPFEMQFKARINRATSAGSGDDKLIKELKKMLRDEKNGEYKDQIYYALADIELERQDRDQAKVYLTKSAYYSLNNPLQKGLSFEKLGNLSFEEKNYVYAQKYYDSSAQVLPDTYDNKEPIKKKAEKLFDLVENIEIAAYEDSVQRIAELSPSEREKFAKKLVKQLAEEKEAKRIADAKRMEEIRELQEEYAQQNNGQGGKFYWNNSKAMAEGFNEFRRIWGQRENEDNWRRSNKEIEATFDFENDSIPRDSLQDTKPQDEMSVDELLAGIPTSDSAIGASNDRLMQALYMSGIIYEQQLKESKLAAKQFDDVLDRTHESKYKVMSAFELYKMYKDKDASKTNYYSNYIQNNYPNSDYANFLRDPEFFKKKKEIEAIALEDYLKSVQRFEQGVYYPVITKANLVIAEDKENKFRSKYMLLKAMSQGQINPDKTTIIPILEQLIAEYPGTQEETRAKEMLDLIKNGVPESVPVDFTQPASLYTYKNNDKMYVMVFLKPDQKGRESITSISNFNREYFSRDKLITKSMIVSDKINLVVVKDFDKYYDAEDYIRAFKKNKRNLRNLVDNELLFISPENYKIFVQDKNLKTYQDFYDDNY